MTTHSDPNAGRPAGGTAQALIRQELADLLDVSNDAIYLRDFATGAIRYWSRGAAAVFGYGPDEELGLNGQALLPTEFPVPLSPPAGANGGA